MLVVAHWPVGLEVRVVWPHYADLLLMEDKVCDLVVCSYYHQLPHIVFILFGLLEAEKSSFPYKGRAILRPC
jgi:hypothetical protein